MNADKRGSYQEPALLFLLRGRAGSVLPAFGLLPAGMRGKAARVIDPLEVQTRGEVARVDRQHPVEQRQRLRVFATSEQRDGQLEVGLRPELELELRFRVSAEDLDQIDCAGLALHLDRSERTVGQPIPVR